MLRLVSRHVFRFVFDHDVHKMANSKKWQYQNFESMLNESMLPGPRIFPKNNGEESVKSVLIKKLPPYFSA